MKQVSNKEIASSLEWKRVIELKNILHTSQRDFSKKKRNWKHKKGVELSLYGILFPESQSKWQIPRLKFLRKKKNNILGDGISLIYFLIYNIKKEKIPPRICFFFFLLNSKNLFLFYGYSQGNTPPFSSSAYSGPQNFLTFFLSKSM